MESPPSIPPFSPAGLYHYLFRVQLVKSLHMQRKVIRVVFPQFIIDGAGIQPEQQREDRGGWLNEKNKAQEAMCC